MTKLFGCIQSFCLLQTATGWRRHAAYLRAWARRNLELTSRRNIIAALYEGSGESKSEFSRKFAAATGAPGAAGVRRYLDRALREIARQERKARLGHSAKKES